jgi:chromosome segregation ATPase
MNDYKRASEYFERTKHSRKEMMNAIHRAMAELDKEYLTLLEQLQQAQAKIEQYERARQSYLQACDELEAHANEPDIVLSIVSELRQALEGES